MKLANSEIVLTAAQLGTNFDNAPQIALADFTSPLDPVPIVVHLSSQNTPGGNPNRSQALRWFVGGPSITLQRSPDSAGFCGLMLQYGAGTAVRRVVMDWKPGSYQLPPCTFARASVIAYKTVGGAFLTGVKLGVALSAGLTAAPGRPEVTMGSGINGTGGGGVPLSFAAVVPAQARWVDTWADCSSTLNPGDTTLPKLVIQENTGRAAATPFIFRDYVNQVFVPSWGPVECGGMENMSLTVKNLNATTPEVSAWIRFWLEL